MWVGNVRGQEKRERPKATIVSPCRNVHVGGQRYGFWAPRGPSAAVGDTHGRLPMGSRSNEQAHFQGDKQADT